MRWHDGVACHPCVSTPVVKDERNDTQPDRQRYECRGSRTRFDDLAGTGFAGHHLPLRARIACLYLIGLNLLALQIAREFGRDKGDARAMIATLRRGIVDRTSPEKLTGEVECDELHVVAGYKGHHEAVRKIGGLAAADA